MLILITVGFLRPFGSKPAELERQIQPSKGRLRNNRIAVITLKRAVCEYPTSVLTKSRCTISGEKNESNEKKRKERKERKVRLERFVCCIFAEKTFLLCKRLEVERKVTGDVVTAKIRKNLPAYVRAYVRTEYLLILLSPCHPSPRKDKEQ